MRPIAATPGARGDMDAIVIPDPRFVICCEGSPSPTAPRSAAPATRAARCRTRVIPAHQALPSCAKGGTSGPIPFKKSVGSFNCVGEASAVLGRGLFDPGILPLPHYDRPCYNAPCSHLFFYFGL